MIFYNYQLFPGLSILKAIMKLSHIVLCSIHYVVGTEVLLYISLFNPLQDPMN